MSVIITGKSQLSLGVEKIFGDNVFVFDDVDELPDFNYENESFGEMGFSKQEFNENEELVDVEEESEEIMDEDIFGDFEAVLEDE